MQKIIFPSFVWILLLCTGLWAQAQPAPQATVDQTSVDAGDSLVLTITVEGSSDAEPDFSVLKKDFEFFSQGQSTQTSLSNGRVSRRTEWQVALIPKRSGAVTIPPIAVGSAKTEAIAIQVNAANQTATNDGSEPIFLETQVDRGSVYVQQQLLFTVRVFIAAGMPLDNLQLTDPEFDNATSKRLAENTSRRTVNGTQYAVHERTYAIFPQQAGDLTVPELIFSAVEMTRSRSMFDFPGQGRALRRLSKQIQVKVKPIPPSFSGDVWLPARNLTLAASWDGDPHHLKAGDSITRHITIRADGVLAAQLPAPKPAVLDRAKIYADQPTLDDQIDASGAHGKRVENMAVIPTAGGTLRLPETKIVWWDLDSDSEKVATLDGETLTVAGGLASANTTTNATPTTTTSITPSNPVQSASNTIVGASAGDASLQYWQIACAALALLWVATLVLYWRARRNPTLGDGVLETTTQKDRESEKNAWQALVAACRNNDPIAARQALLTWARIYFERDIYSIDQLAALSDEAALRRELLQLDNRLFGTLHDSGAWNGELFLQVMKDLKNRNTKTPAATAKLPPLYPIT